MRKKKPRQSVHQHEQGHLLNHGPTPEPIKRAAALQASNHFLSTTDGFTALTEVLDMLDLWPADNPHAHSDEGLISV